MNNLSMNLCTDEKQEAAAEMKLSLKPRRLGFTHVSMQVRVQQHDGTGQSVDAVCGTERQTDGSDG